MAEPCSGDRGKDAPDYSPWLDGRSGDSRTDPTSHDSPCEPGVLHFPLQAESRFRRVHFVAALRPARVTRGEPRQGVFRPRAPEYATSAQPALLSRNVRAPLMIPVPRSARLRLPKPARPTPGTLPGTSRAAAPWQRRTDRHPAP